MTAGPRSGRAAAAGRWSGGGRPQVRAERADRFGRADGVRAHAAVQPVLAVHARPGLRRVAHHVDVDGAEPAAQVGGPPGELRHPGADHRLDPCRDRWGVRDVVHAQRHDVTPRRRAAPDDRGELGIQDVRAVRRAQRVVGPAGHQGQIRPKARAGLSCSART